MLITRFILLLGLFIMPLKKSSPDLILIKGNKAISSFYMLKREVTMLEFQEFQKATGYLTFCEKSNTGIVYNPYQQKAKGINWRHDLIGKSIDQADYAILPVTRLTIKDAMAYAKWRGMRIPSKMEWLYAAEGGFFSKGFKYPGSNRAREVSWFDNNSDERKKPVMSKGSNELGLFDLGGNVSEWVINSKNSLPESIGGSFFNDKDFFDTKSIHNAWQVSSKLIESAHDPTWGFRCVKDLQ